jgi:hypothetical protein
MGWDLVGAVFDLMAAGARPCRQGQLFLLAGALERGRLFDGGTMSNLQADK